MTSNNFLELGFSTHKMVGIIFHCSDVYGGLHNMTYVKSWNQKALDLKGVAEQGSSILIEEKKNCLLPPRTLSTLCFWKEMRLSRS